jgi:hypothetical protein
MRASPAECVNTFPEQVNETDGTGSRAYLGCDGGEMTYAEHCVPAGYPSYPDPTLGIPGPLLALGTDLKNLTVHAASYSDCACKFFVQGPGCWKVNDMTHFYPGELPALDPRTSTSTSTSGVPFPHPRLQLLTQRSGDRHPPLQETNAPSSRSSPRAPEDECLRTGRDTPR